MHYLEEVKVVRLSAADESRPPGWSSAVRRRARSSWTARPPAGLVCSWKTGETNSRVTHSGSGCERSRRPSVEEKNNALAYLGNDAARLSQFAWLLFNLDEFIYAR